MVHCTHTIIPKDCFVLFCLHCTEGKEADSKEAEEEFKVYHLMSCCFFLVSFNIVNVKINFFKIISVMNLYIQIFPCSTVCGKLAVLRPWLRAERLTFGCLNLMLLM